jgi:hypothetical protein
LFEIFPNRFSQFGQARVPAHQGCQSARQAKEQSVLRRVGIKDGRRPIEGMLIAQDGGQVESHREIRPKKLRQPIGIRVDAPGDQLQETFGANFLRRSIA